MQLSRLFGLILFVLAIYVGITVFTEGVEGAFGGIFVKLGMHTPAADPSGTDPVGLESRPSSTPILHRVEDRWRDYIDTPARRIDALEDD
jgi:hypothetical protein